MFYQNSVFRVSSIAFDHFLQTPWHTMELTLENSFDSSFAHTFSIAHIKSLALTVMVAFPQLYPLFPSTGLSSLQGFYKLQFVLYKFFTGLRSGSLSSHSRILILLFERKLVTTLIGSKCTALHKDRAPVDMHVHFQLIQPQFNVLGTVY